MPPSRSGRKPNATTSHPQIFFGSSRFAEEAALKQGMEAKPKEFAEKGAEVYVKA